MKKILFVLLFYMSLMSLSYGQTWAKETDPFLVRMFDYAKTHNIKALEGLNNEVKLKNDQNLIIAYSLALYIADPEKYKQQYVDNFPTDSEGTNYLTEQIEIKELTPSFFFIDAIGLIAKGGNDKAIEKVIIGISHSDGGATELFCDYLGKLFDKQPQKTIKAFSRIEERQRQNAYSCFELMDEKDFSTVKRKLKKLKAKATKQEMKIIREIESRD